MRVPGLRYRDEWLPNFFPAKQVGPDHFVRLSRTGAMQLLSGAENAQLDEISMDEALFERLEQTSHLITAQNSSRVLEDLKRWHDRTYAGPGLHIVVLSKRCNLNCTYCHMNPENISADSKRFDMQPDVADAIIRFALGSPAPFLGFEFQGGEPFLNFEGMKYFVEEARRQNEAVGKRLRFSVVSNLMVATDEHIAYCKENRINVSYSLNGPEDIHDSFRVTRSGAGSFRKVMERLTHFRDRFPGVLSASPLCVVGASNAKELKRTIDFYHSEGFKDLAILKLKALGNARKEKLPFDIQDFLHYYLDALDYIYEKNRQENENYSERVVRVVLAKILQSTDTGFVDWRNPVGDFGSAITYDHDGEILPSDEARSMRSEFGLGNVKGTTYDALIRNKATFRSMNLSLRDRDPQCRECAFNPYCGVLPVLDYARTGDATPRPHASEECLQTLAVVEWVLRKLVEDPIPLLRMMPGMDAALVEMANGLPTEPSSQAMPPMLSVQSG
ncbi:MULTISPECIES: radical SAM protein [Myxococcus]|uniref:Radical SAM protein n=1 Tax=Myxococcus xanthus TaxID=34 RepID=A0AAE6G3R1_MYXXA|nr:MULTISPECIES: radical SAM protein [Myxococcus]QDE70140.1 radical SAM protein [Myxococcus xanthus]QDE77419.1 radical SAM protein [Myxococcus xanthus]QDE98967.1 radical SAM protein [Myxococcus xanthus]QDF06638.1 radical SAM protein [Myxococcus xanthus]WAM24242.1 radical SAM protein [Myxococcus sp. NMCA1]